MEQQSPAWLRGLVETPPRLKPTQDWRRPRVVALGWGSWSTALRRTELGKCCSQYKRCHMWFFFLPVHGLTGEIKHLIALVFGCSWLIHLKLGQRYRDLGDLKHAAMWFVPVSLWENCLCFMFLILQHVAETIARQLNSWQFRLCRIGSQGWDGYGSFVFLCGIQSLYCM